MLNEKIGNWLSWERVWETLLRERQHIGELKALSAEAIINETHSYTLLSATNPLILFDMALGFRNGFAPVEPNTDTLSVATALTNIKNVPGLDHPTILSIQGLAVVERLILRLKAWRDQLKTDGAKSNDVLNELGNLDKVFSGLMKPYLSIHTTVQPFPQHHLAEIARIKAQIYLALDDRESALRILREVRQEITPKERRINLWEKAAVYSGLAWIDIVEGEVNQDIPRIESGIRELASALRLSLNQQIFDEAIQIIRQVATKTGLEADRLLARSTVTKTQEMLAVRISDKQSNVVR